MSSYAYEQLQSGYNARYASPHLRPFNLRHDGTPILSPVCEDFRNGKGEEYVYQVDFLLDGNVVTSATAPRPGTDAEIKKHTSAERADDERLRRKSSSYTGRTNRPIAGRSGKVEAQIREILSSVDIGCYDRSLHITITPSDYCIPVGSSRKMTLQEWQLQFLRRMEDVIRFYENANTPYESIRIMEAGGPTVPVTFGKPNDRLRLHDHYLIIAHDSLTGQERRALLQVLKDALIKAAEKYLRRPLVRRAGGEPVAIDVSYVTDRKHMKALTLRSKKKHGRPYLCGDVPKAVGPVRRRWFCHRNLPPDLSAAPLVQRENKVYVSGRLASVQLDFDKYSRLRKRLFSLVNMKLPDYAVHFALPVPSYLVLEILQDLGVDLSQVPVKHRRDFPAESCLLDLPPPGAGVIKTWRR